MLSNPQPKTVKKIVTDCFYSLTNIETTSLFYWEPKYSHFPLVYSHQSLLDATTQLSTEAFKVFQTALKSKAFAFVTNADEDFVPRVSAGFVVESDEEEEEEEEKSHHSESEVEEEEEEEKVVTPPPKVVKEKKRHRPGSVTSNRGKDEEEDADYVPKVRSSKKVKKSN